MPLACRGKCFNHWPRIATFSNIKGGKTLTAFLTMKDKVIMSIYQVARVFLWQASIWETQLQKYPLYLVPLVFSSILLFILLGISKFTAIKSIL